MERQIATGDCGAHIAGRVTADKQSEIGTSVLAQVLKNVRSDTARRDLRSGDRVCRIPDRSEEPSPGSGQDTR